VLAVVHRRPLAVRRRELKRAQRCPVRDNPGVPGGGTRGKPGVIRIDRRRWWGQAGIKKSTAKNFGRAITMAAIIALVLIAVVALTIVGFALHFLFSPWLLVAIAIVAWIKFRPRRSHQ